MLSYRLDAHVLEVYNGTIWEAPETNLTTKGDLATFDTAPTRLAVGSDGQTLVANSANASGLGWQPLQAAGKNAVINGGMDIWQRGTSVALAAATAAANGYNADRWDTSTGASQAITISRQPTADTTNLPNIQYCLRYQRNSGQTGIGGLYLIQSIETANAIPFAGKTITFSFYARAGANYSNAGGTLNAYVSSGTGTDQNGFTMTGSAGVGTGVIATLTTTWQRFSYTATVPITATELATNFLFTPVGTAGANDYYEVTGVQLELGSVATTFSRAGGTLQGELAACKRYLPSVLVGSGNSLTGYASASANSYVCAQFDVQARVAPTGLTVSGTSYTLFAGGGGTGTPTAIAFDSAGVNSSLIAVTTTVGSPTLAANNAVALRSTAAASQILFTGCEL